MYLQLLEDDGHEQLTRRTPAPLISTSRPPGFYRVLTVALASLSVVLFISLIAVTAHYKKPSGGESAWAPQTQDANVSALVASIAELQQEKKKLQEENQLLHRRLRSTTAPDHLKPTLPPIVCPFDWVSFNTSCYLISRNSRSWPEAKSYCESEGAHLAIIHTADEQTFLWERLPRGHWNSYWFGITDAQTEDEWQWVDGTPLVGGFWEDGEPNNHINEDCGYIVKTTVLERVAVRSWYDAPCSMDLPYICEKEAGPGTSTALPH